MDRERIEELVAAMEVRAQQTPPALGNELRVWVTSFKAALATGDRTPSNEVPTHIVSELFEAVARYVSVCAHKTVDPRGGELEELAHAWTAIVMARVPEKLGVELPRL